VRRHDVHDVLYVKCLEFNVHIYIYIMYIWLYTSCEVKKPVVVSSVKCKAWGIPSVSVASVRP